MSSRKPSSGSARSNPRPNKGTEDFWKTVLDGNEATAKERVAKPQRQPTPPSPGGHLRNEQRTRAPTSQAQGSEADPHQQGGRPAPQPPPSPPTVHRSSGQGEASHSSSLQEGTKGSSSQIPVKHQLSRSPTSQASLQKRFACPECWKEFERLGHLTDHGRA